MHIRMLKLLQPDQAQVVHRDLAPLSIGQTRLQLEPEHHVAEGIEPWEQGRFLEHDKALLARTSHEVPVRQDLTAIRLGQACHDVEERGLAAAAWADKTDELALQHGQGYVLQSLDGGPL